MPTFFHRGMLAWPLLACLSSGAAAQVPLHHPIFTHSAAAQSAFDRGLALVYAFNFQDAERAFQHAAALDPAAPMPYWGLALAQGPNLNARQPSVAEERAATDALARARSLAAQEPASPEAAEERAYIGALTLRLNCDPHPAYARLEIAYGEAMAVLSRKNPDDPDAATLYAESLMEQRAWFNWIGQPAFGPPAQKILAELHSVLNRWPNHIGANHLLIHAAEGAGEPALALGSAQRLSVSPRFAGDGHLLHMPAHVYLRTGDFQAAERVSLAAAAADSRYLHHHPDDTGYAYGYALHNLSFLVYAAKMNGDFATAWTYANQLANQAGALAGARPNAEGYLVAPLEVLVRFDRWAQILALPAPAAGTNNGYRYYWLYARTCALAASGDIAEARREYQALETASWRLHGVVVNVPRMRRPALLGFTHELASARIALAQGHSSYAAALLRQAAALQDKLTRADPPEWYPLRETLGAALLAGGQPADAAAAFEASLRRTPNDPRAIFGLEQAFAAQGLERQADAEQAEFQKRWHGGALSIQDF